VQPIRTIDWEGDHVVMLDQRELPGREIYLRLKTHREVADAITTLAIRGAPAIGVAGAMGVALGALEQEDTSKEVFLHRIAGVAETLVGTRPTAVNLRWAIERMKRVMDRFPDAVVTRLKTELVAEAKRLKDEDIQINHAMGAHGQTLLSNGDTVLTHCNAGALATAGFGTALGVIYAAVNSGKKITVYADETRPVLQGARLTAWELTRAGIPTTVIADNMAASLMAKGRIHKVIVGADRIAANGDVANKIGTYGVAVCARHHGIPFYVAAPLSTVDICCPTGGQIPIEEREAREVAEHGGKRLIPENVSVYNPAFDVTPAALVSAIITEKGVVQSPNEASLRRLF
jgi:methylthioribose-1-phosphate isomerase